jgi:hypothetical protein
MERWNIGVMEYWNDGVRKWRNGKPGECGEGRSANRQKKCQFYLYNEKDLYFCSPQKSG